jgi:predicted MFS family arabinose efflux permease
VVATTIGSLGTNTMPMLFGALMDGLDLDATDAGLLGSIELGGLALAALLLAPWVARVSRSGFAMVGASVAALAYGLCAVSGSFVALALARLVAGAGAGLVLASGNAAAAGARDPERLFALVTLIGGGAASLLIIGLPYLLGPWGYPGAFILFSVICFAALPFLRGLPRARQASGPELAGARASGAAAALTLTSVFLFALGEQGLWSVSERIGVGIGLELDVIGGVLGGTTLAGLAGAGVAALLGSRYGRTGPLVVGLLASALARAGVAFSGTGTEYLLAQLAWGTSFLFVLPYMLGTAAALDPTGRWTAAAGAITMVGAAMAPAAAGFLTDAIGTRGLGLCTAASGLVALAAIVPVARGADRGWLRRETPGGT